jgi:hypothetical protein
MATASLIEPTNTEQTTLFDLATKAEEIGMNIRAGKGLLTEIVSNMPGGDDSPEHLTIGLSAVLDRVKSKNDELVGKLYALHWASKGKAEVSHG